MCIGLTWIPHRQRDNDIDLTLIQTFFFAYIGCHCQAGKAIRGRQAERSGVKIIKLFSSLLMLWPGNAKGGSIAVLLTSCLTGLDSFVLQIKTKIVSCHTTDSKPVKQEGNSTVILPPLVFPGITLAPEKVPQGKLKGR
jgi:hypothetical protein